MKTTGNFLFDTNIVIAIFRAEPKVVEPANHAKSIYIPVPVIGELYFGAFKSEKPIENILKIEDFLSDVTVLDCDKQTAVIFGEITYQVVKKAMPIPENDLWIASIAIQYNLTLVSRDQHFKRIEGLDVVKW